MTNSCTALDRIGRAELRVRINREATIWTPDKIEQIIELMPKQVEAALVLLYNNQTRDEQEQEITVDKNGIGFNGYDARFGSSLAKQILGGKHLTDKQLSCARKMLPKYYGQLCRIINERRYLHE